MSTSLVNRIEDAQEILTRVRREVAPGEPTALPSTKIAAIELLDDIDESVKIIRRKISPCPT